MACQDACSDEGGRWCLLNLLKQNVDVCSTVLGQTNVLIYKMYLTQDMPIKQKMYIVFPAKWTIQKKPIEEMLAADIIKNTGSVGVTVQKVEKRLWRACKKREKLLGRKNGRICCFSQQKIDCVCNLLGPDGLKVTRLCPQLEFIMGCRCLYVSEYRRNWNLSPCKRRHGTQENHQSVSGSSLFCHCWSIKEVNLSLSE